jgi:D-alanine transaminase
VLPERRNLPLSQAKISVLDRGFIFGDGIYEVIPVYGRRLFRFDEHMARLARSLDKLRIPNPHSRDEWLQRCRAWCGTGGRQPAEDQVVYIQVTRGVALRDHVMPEGIDAHGVHDVQPDEAAVAEQRHHGVACVTARDFRWERGDIKSVSLLGNVLARQMSADHGALETIMFRDGWLTEASGSNVWIVHEGALLGPPKSEHVLEGIRVRPAGELCADWASPTTCAPSPRPTCGRRRGDADLGHQGGAARHPLDGEPVGHGALRGKPGPVYAGSVRGLPARQDLQSI